MKSLKSRNSIEDVFPLPTNYHEVVSNTESLRILLQSNICFGKIVNVTMQTNLTRETVLCEDLKFGEKLFSVQ